MRSESALGSYENRLGLSVKWIGGIVGVCFAVGYALGASSSQPSGKGRFVCLL